MSVMPISCRISSQDILNYILQDILQDILAGYPICCLQILIGHPLQPCGPASCLQVPSQPLILLYCACALNEGGGFSTTCGALAPQRPQAAEHRTGRYLPAERELTSDPATPKHLPEPEQGLLQSPKQRLAKDIGWAGLPARRPPGLAAPPRADHRVPASLTRKPDY